MRLVSFLRSGDGTTRIGVLDREEIIDLDIAARHARLPRVAPSRASTISTMRDFLAGGQTAMTAAHALVKWSKEKGEARHSLGSCSLLPPVPNPSKIICVGLNYQRVAAAVSFEPGEGLPIFHKAASALAPHGGSIVLPALDVGPVIAETELALVIGRCAHHVAADEAFEVVAGYTVMIDVTANMMMDRDTYRFRRPEEPVTSHAVFFRAKDYDTFAPLGPFIVTRDEVPDERIQSLRIDGLADGIRFVSGTTAEMLVDVPTIISAVTSVVTLEPGDIIATGHPGHISPRALAVGETIEATIEKIGTLRVTVKQEAPTS